MYNYFHFLIGILLPLCKGTFFLFYDWTFISFHFLFFSILLYPGFWFFLLTDTYQNSSDIICHSISLACPARGQRADNVEPVCCKKQQKSSDQLLVCRIGDHWRTWMIPNWSSRINFIPFRIFRGPLLHKPVTGQQLFCCFLQQTGSKVRKETWDR